MKAALAAAKSGLRLARQRLSLSAWVYSATLVSALPFGIGVGSLLHSELSHRAVAGEFAEGLAPDLMVELLLEHGSALSTMVPLLLGVWLAWLFMSTFLTGAVMMAACSEDPGDTSEFFARGGRVYGRLLRLLIFAAPYGTIAIGLVVVLATKLSGWLVEDWVSDGAAFAAKWGLALAALGLIAWIVGSLDFMRVEAVAKGERRARYAFVRGLARSLRSPIRTLAVVLPFMLAGVGMTLLGALADSHLTRSGWIVIGLGLILQQGIAFSRSFFRVAQLCSEVAFVRADRPGS